MTTALARRAWIVAWVVLGLTAAAAEKAAPPQEMFVYFGTYTRGESKGIYVSRFDLAAGKLQPPELAAEVQNPSFVALHPTKPLLYAVGEMAEVGGKKGGAVSALAIDPSSGKLKLLNQQSSRGAGPCHLTVDRSGRCVLVANYSGGSVACLPIEADGRLGEATAFIQHAGSSANPKRQQGPHAHSVNLDAAGRFAFVADLGLDKVLVYRLDAEHGKLTPNDPPFAAVAPGAGPRHFAFHPRGRFAYVINELDCTVTAFRYDPGRGALETLHSVSTLPEGFQGQNTTAEVRVHPSGKFVYGSNRGHNSIALFRVDEATGKLTFDGCEPSGGKTPRNFNIDPTGRFLLAAHQDSDNVAVFRIDLGTGKLTPTGGEVRVGSPVCVRFWRATP